MKYEIGARLSDRRITWISGGLPGRVHDIRLTVLGGIFDKLHPDEYVLGDTGQLLKIIIIYVKLGYLGNPRIVITHKRAYCRLLVVAQTLNNRKIKTFIGSRINVPMSFMHGDDTMHDRGTSLAIMFDRFPVHL